MTDVYDKPAIHLRRGKLSERPIIPPDKSIMYWALDVGIMYGVTDAMQWKALNPTDGLQTAEYSISYLQAPTWIYFVNEIGNNLYMASVLVEVTTIFDGSAPTLEIGDEFDQDRLLTVSETDLRYGLKYYKQTDAYVPNGANVQAQIDPDGSTSGIFRVVFTFDLSTS